jgi:hypothetical protein
MPIYHKTWSPASQPSEDDILMALSDSLQEAADMQGAAAWSTAREEDLDEYNDVIVIAYFGEAIGVDGENENVAPEISDKHDAIPGYGDVPTYEVEVPKEWIIDGAYYILKQNYPDLDKDAIERIGGETYQNPYTYVDVSGTVEAYGIPKYEENPVFPKKWGKGVFELGERVEASTKIRHFVQRIRGYRVQEGFEDIPIGTRGTVIGMRESHSRSATRFFYDVEFDGFEPPYPVVSEDQIRKVR